MFARLDTLFLSDQNDMHAKLLGLLHSIDSPICRMGRQLDNLGDQLEREIFSVKPMLVD